MDLDDKPPHVVKLAKGGQCCMSCGGEVDDSGMAYGGEVDTPQSKELSAQEKKAMFDKARSKK